MRDGRLLERRGKGPPSTSKVADQYGRERVSGTATRPADSERESSLMGIGSYSDGRKEIRPPSTWVYDPEKVEACAHRSRGRFALSKLGERRRVLPSPFAPARRHNGPVHSHRRLTKRSALVIMNELRAFDPPHLRRPDGADQGARRAARSLFSLPTGGLMPSASSPKTGRGRSSPTCTKRRRCPSPDYRMGTEANVRLVGRNALVRPTDTRRQKTTLNAVNGMGKPSMVITPGQGVRPSEVADWIRRRGFKVGERRGRPGEQRAGDRGREGGAVHDRSVCAARV